MSENQRINRVQYKPSQKLIQFLLSVRQKHRIGRKLGTESRLTLNGRKLAGENQVEFQNFIQSLCRSI